MTTVYLRWLLAALIGTILATFIALTCSLWFSNAIQPELLVILAVLMMIFAFLTYASLFKYLDKLTALLDQDCVSQAKLLDTIPKQLILLAIVLASGLSLVLELSIIRWQGATFEFFAFYKNFGLLSCFAGLGIGYALALQNRIPLVLTVPILVLQLAYMTFLRHGLDFTWIRSLVVLPIKEQLTTGFAPDTTVPEYIALYSLLPVVFVLTVLALVPVGQLCGRLMSRTNPLLGYGANLFGSLCGVLLMIVLSALSTPPSIWFIIAFMVCGCFTAYRRRALIMSAVATAIGVCAITWPVGFGFERVFSPYQVLERGPGDHGWTLLKAAGIYYQRVLDLSMSSRKAFPDLEKVGRYYDLPYTFHPAPKRVLVLGAGMGNDVAAALRNGAEHVDAVEIDPLIMRFGQKYHPENVYGDIRVHKIVDDARAYLRQTKESYDAIVFGLLDSHSLSSHASSLRVDSYVYTIEAFKEARAHLNDNGLLSLSFSIPSPLLAKKIYLMVEEAFDGHPPLCIGGEYDVSFSFFQTKDGNIAQASPYEHICQTTGFRNLSQLVNKIDSPVDYSTDDWPFLYMVKHQWPVSYLPMIAMVIAITYFFNRSFGQHVSMKNLDFFFLGAGFMLIEAKAVTELGLSLGNTWQVTSIVVASIILMAFLSNVLVLYTKVERPFIPYLILLVSLMAGLFVAHMGSTPTALYHVAILTFPVVFSGIVFSTLLTHINDIGSAMSANLIGAMCGGVLEYAAMNLGYQALYVMTIAIYVLALLFSVARRRQLVS